MNSVNLILFTFVIVFLFNNAVGGKWKSRTSDGGESHTSPSTDVAEAGSKPGGTALWKSWLSGSKKSTPTGVQSGNLGDPARLPTHHARSLGHGRSEKKQSRWKKQKQIKVMRLKKKRRDRQRRLRKSRRRSSTTSTTSTMPTVILNETTTDQTFVPVLLNAKNEI